MLISGCFEYSGKYVKNEKWAGKYDGLVQY